VAAVAAADFFFTVPHYGLRVAYRIDVIALIVFAVVGKVIGTLVHVLAGRA
jgi:K+-sensing histidine kinase KdpD